MKKRSLAENYPKSEVEATRDLDLLQQDLSDEEQHKRNISDPVPGQEVDGGEGILSGQPRGEERGDEVVP